MCHDSNKAIGESNLAVAVTERLIVRTMPMREAVSLMLDALMELPIAFQRLPLWSYPM